ncbi:MAG: ParA family protein [Eubacteriaceae bacterium]|jgi:chromosome partitioning protein
MKTISFFNLKGGCGKTTSLINLGWLLAQREAESGKKILLVDADMQSNLTNSLLEYDIKRPCIYDILTEQRPAADAVAAVRNNIDLIPSSLAMCVIEPRLENTAGKAWILKNALEELQNRYSYCLIDCSPSFSTVTTNALLASDRIFIPVQTEYYAVDGVHLLEETLSYINQQYGLYKQIDCIFAAMFDKRNNINKLQYENLTENFPDKFMKSAVRKNVALVESPIFKESIFEYKPSSPGAEDYRALFNEIEQKGEF